MQTAPDKVVDIIFPDECIQFFYEYMVVAMLHLLFFRLILTLIFKVGRFFVFQIKTN
jgi:hypothetical protein